MRDAGKKVVHRHLAFGFGVSVHNDSSDFIKVLASLREAHTPQ